MENIVIRIKPIHNSVEVLSIASLVPAKDSISDQVCNLEESCGFGVCEKRNVREVSYSSEARASPSVLAQQSLEAGLVSRFVKNNKAPLCVAFGMEPPEE